MSQWHAPNQHTVFHTGTVHRPSVAAAETNAAHLAPPPRLGAMAVTEQYPAARMSGPSRVPRSAVRRGARNAMTLVEMLVATALSLLIVLAVTQVFQLVGDNVMSSRAVAEMSSQLRATSNQLRSDLSQVTVPVRPWTDYDAGQGYFEYYEGPLWDMGHANGNPHAQTTTGDFDDVLMFTAKAEGSPFTGQIAVRANDGSFRYEVIESNVAEIIWFTHFNDRNDNGQRDTGEVTLHRRVLLVKPELNHAHTDRRPILPSPDSVPIPNPNQLTPGEFYHLCDVSVGYRPEFASEDNNPKPTGKWIRFANSLQNLSLRENRTAHRIGGGWPIKQGNSYIIPFFPYPLSRNLLVPQGTVIQNNLAVPIDALQPTPQNTVVGADMLGSAYGKDVILSQVLAFDVQAYDPNVVIRPPPKPNPSASTPDESLLPDDPGYPDGPEYDPRNPKNKIGFGGYVDLCYSRYLDSQYTPSVFSRMPELRSGLRRQLPASTYDTWTMFYERDGINQDRLLRNAGVPLPSTPHGTVDWGTDGLDNDGNGGVDDVGERETSPPYPVPLRGIQVRIRIIDPDSRQVRQATVSSDFIPE